MNDTIIISDLAVLYHVGVPDEERARPQRLLVTVEIENAFGPAVAHDDLKATIDYFAVTQRLLGFGQGRDWKLIEKLASDIAQMILKDFGAEAVAVEVKKFIIPEARYVAVRIRRTR
jgi:FolB domain-containing protein